MRMSKELSEQFKIDEKNQLLHEMQTEFVYKAKELSEEELEDIALKKMSRYARFYKKVEKKVGPYAAGLEETANAVVQIGERVDDIHYTPHNAEVANGFHLGALALSGYNFLRVPFMYLSAYLLNQPVPMTLNNNMRWLYSAITLGLGIAALAAPAAAPVLGFVGAGLGLGASLFFVGKLAFERYKLHREEKALKEDIGRAEQGLADIQEEAKDLEHALSEATDESAIKAISWRIERLKLSYDAQVLELEELYDMQAQNEQLKQQFSAKNVFMKASSVLLALVTIIGLIVSASFPPIGIAILTGVALTSATIIMAQVSAPLFKAAFEWIKNKWSQGASTETLDNNKGNTQDLAVDAQLDEQKEVGSSFSPKLDSTANALREMESHLPVAFSPKAEHSVVHDPQQEQVAAVVALSPFSTETEFEQSEEDEELDDQRLML